MKVKVGATWMSPEGLAELVAVAMVQRATLEAMRLGAAFSKIKTPLVPADMLRRHEERRARERDEQRLDDAFERRNE